MDMNELASALHVLWVSWTNNLIKAYPDLPPEAVVAWKSAWKPFNELNDREKKTRLAWAKYVASDIPRQKQSKPKDPRALQLARDFQQYCLDQNGYKPEVAWATEVKMIKDKLANYTVEEVQDEFMWYLQSECGKKFGTTIKTALSNYCFNKWLQQRGNI